MSKQETLEEAIKREYETRKFNSDFLFDPQSFKLGAKWQQEQQDCCTPAGQIKRYVDCVGCDKKPKQMSKQTAVEWFNDEIIIHLNFDQRLYLKDILKQAKEMEKEQSQNYAIFAIRCDRTEMRILEFNDYIKLEKNIEK
jgi:hypothetical protein